MSKMAVSILTLMEHDRRIQTKHTIAKNIFSMVTPRKHFKAI